MKIGTSLALAATIVVVLSACSSSPAASQVPGATLAPGQTATPARETPVGVVTPAPVGGGAACTGIPMYVPGSPFPSMQPDTSLDAHFPATIDGQPVTDVRSFYVAQWLCAFSGQAGLDRLSQALPNGLNLTVVSQGSANANVDGQDVVIQAFRTPGQDANLLLQSFGALIVAEGGDPSKLSGTVTDGNVGGKAVKIYTDPTDGTKSFIDISGDTMFAVTDVTESQAGKVFNALL